MEKINNVVKSPIAPKTTNAIWINTEDNTINVFDEHQGWIQVSGGGAEGFYIGTQEERLALEPKNGYVFNQVEEDGTVHKYFYEQDEWVLLANPNLMIGTKEERESYPEPVEGMEWNQVEFDEEFKKYIITRYIRENNEWIELESPQTEQEERVSLHVTTYDGVGIVEGLNVGITDNRTHQTYARILDEYGNCSFKITKGHTYTITIQDLEGYHSLPDETFLASQDERSINMIFQAPATNYETIIAHITVYNKNLVDITTQDTDFIGLSLELEVEGESNPRVGVVGDNHQCIFIVEYGKQYTLTSPIVTGYRIRYEASKRFTHVAGVPQRELPMHYMIWEASGIFGIDANGATYDFDTIEAMTQQERSVIIAVGINSSRLQSANAGFCYKLPTGATSKQWADQNVEFDKTLLPFKQNHASAVLDLDGALNTEKIIDIGDSMSVETPAADYCQSQILSIGGESKIGFLPAYGQLYALAENIAVINALHGLLGYSSPGFTSGNWWSSTQYNADYAVRLGYGSFGNNFKTASYTTLVCWAL